MYKSHKKILPNWPPPILLSESNGSIWISPDGEIEEISHKEVVNRATNSSPLVCHSRATNHRLQCKPFLNLDVLELFAFIRPAEFCVPTPKGLAKILHLASPNNQVDSALALLDIAEFLLDEVENYSQKEKIIPITELMHSCNWSWATLVLESLKIDNPIQKPIRITSLDVWSDLPEWSEHAPEPPASTHSVTTEEAVSRLKEMLHESSETRSGQLEYTSKIVSAFDPRNEKESPNIVLADAGTGVGKTLGYLAPATIWAEKNKSPVWISTFTRNLQHQIDSELNRLYPEPIRKSQKVVIRKGRENYLCLLNLEEASRQLITMPQYGVALGLMARWASKTRNGDMVGGDFPAWLSDLLGQGRTLGLTDKRGECIYSACSHYHKCFIEKSIRTARRADIVIANHALVMIQSALAEVTDSYLPTRYIFDEGHHLFEAADAAFSAYLSGAETHELRRWLLGSETKTSGRSRGLKKRLEDLLSDDQNALRTMDRILTAARCLPSEGWLNRLNSQYPSGPTESFLLAIRQQVYARSENLDTGYSLEVQTNPPIEELVNAVKLLNTALESLVRPIIELCFFLSNTLDEKAETLETSTRLRIEAIVKSLNQRGKITILAWQAMLKSINKPVEVKFVDWLEIERILGRDVDIGMRRHWLDPTIPLKNSVFRSAHGAVITSATLKDEFSETKNEWENAEKRTGTIHLNAQAIRVAVASPFDYANQTQVIIVNDVRKNDVQQVAAAFRELFIAAGGGALGIFTAIQRLRAIHEQIFDPLDQLGLKLYSQHVDGLNLSTLMDIFRMEENSCLLGTDAARDGVDIPGRSLRLIAFDRVPWPRPSVLHRARQELFGKSTYSDTLTRLKLKQAFGRLIRSKSDRGVFLLIDAAMPTRLLSAFPKETEVTRCGLADAIKNVKDFLHY